MRQTYTEEQKVMFTVSQVRLIHDAITRASTATTELSQIMAAFNNQYRHEERVLTEAKQLLWNFLAAASK